MLESLSLVTLEASKRFLFPFQNGNVGLYNVSLISWGLRNTLDKPIRAR
jgi:hypothetical protein